MKRDRSTQAGAPGEAALDSSLGRGPIFSLVASLPCSRSSGRADGSVTGGPGRDTAALERSRSRLGRRVLPSATPPSSILRRGLRAGRRTATRGSGATRRGGRRRNVHLLGAPSPAREGPTMPPSMDGDPGSGGRLEGPVDRATAGTTSSRG